jgi:hypothetical protein
MIKRTQKISLLESGAIRDALDKTAKVTDRVLPLPCYFENEGIVLSYYVADTAVSLRYNHSARKESTQVVFEIRANTKKDYAAARLILSGMAHSEELVTAEKNYS